MEQNIQQQAQQQAPAINQNPQLAQVKNDISAQVLARIDQFQQTGEIVLPKDYVPANALKSAYVILSDPRNNILEKCDKSSIAEALLKMVVYGVSPIKKQCYFVPYGNKLECSISYMGNIALAKRFGNLKEIKGNVVFEGDVFEYELDANTGRRKILKHQQSMSNINMEKIVGAYAVAILKDGTADVEVMNIGQIRQAWAQGGSKGNSPAHKNFTDQMCIKTVINRACKLLISTSDDSALYDPLDEDTAIDVVSENVEYEVKTNANTEPLDFSSVAEEASVENFEVIGSEEPSTFNHEFEMHADQTGPGF